MASRWKPLVVVLAAAATIAASAAASSGGSFIVTPLFSNNGVPGTTTDTNLVNAWGLGAGPTTPWWVSDNGMGVSTLYNGNGTGTKIPLTVTVGDSPTGARLQHAGAD